MGKKKERRIALGNRGSGGGVAMAWSGADSRTRSGKGQLEGKGTGS